MEFSFWLYISWDSCLQSTYLLFERGPMQFTDHTEIYEEAEHID